MAESNNMVSRFWTTNGTGDGTSGGYTAANFSDYMRDALTGGAGQTNYVLFGVGNNLAVTNTGLQVNVATGAAIVAGRYAENAGITTTDAVAAAAGTTRIDRVILRADTTAQTVRVVVKQGTSVAPPSLTYSGTTFEVSLAQIVVTPTTISSITDERAYVRSPGVQGWLASTAGISITGGTTVGGNLVVSGGTITLGSDVAMTRIGANALSIPEALTVNTIAASSNGSSLGTTTITSATMTTAVITGAQITNLIGSGIVGATNIAANAVTSAKIASGAVLTVNLGDGAVTSAKIDAGAIVADNLADGAVTTVKLAANSIVNTTISAFAVAANSIATNAITTDKINAYAVTAGKISSYAVTSIKIDTGAVTSNELASGSVTTVKINSDAVNGQRIGDYAVKFGGRQGGNSNSWNTPGTSIYKSPISATYGNEVLMCSGSIQVAISSSADGSSDVTFADADTASAPFATLPIVFATVSGNQDYIVDVPNITTSAATIRLRHRALTVATVNVTVFWMAMGTTTL